MSRARSGLLAGIITTAAALSCRDDPPNQIDDRDTTIETPAGHTTHETGAGEFGREKQDKRGVPDYVSAPYRDAGVSDASAVQTETTVPAR